MGTNSSINKVSLGLLIVSVLFFYLNFAIGDTILGNVIVLFVSLVTGVSSLSASALAVKKTERKAVPVAIMICAGAIIVSICLLVISDNVSVGYGP